MIDKKLGFIGCGHMASAIIEGLVNSKTCSSKNILASAAHEKHICGIDVITNNVSAASRCDILVMAVRPNIFKTVAKQIAGVLKEACVEVCCAGCAWLGKNCTS